MGYIAGLVPGTTSSCNKLDEDSSRRQSFKAGSGPIISISDVDESLPNFKRKESFLETKIKFSLPLQRKSVSYQQSQPVLTFREDIDEALSSRRDTLQESRIKFALPTQRKSITHQHSQPVLTFRERARGSPRFPHKIMPTSSLTELGDRRRSYVSSFRRSSQASSVTKKKKNQMGAKWRSMEDASTTILPGSRRGSGVLALSCLPSSANPTVKTRAASYSPNCDVWSTAEFGIPLSELATKDNS